MSSAAITSRSGLMSPANRGELPRAPQAAPPDSESFERLLQGAAKSNDVDAVRKAATEFVATAFIRPVLSQLRESTLRPKNGPFAENAAEKRFGPLLDERLADQITKAARFPLIDTIVDRVTRRSGKINVSS